MKKITIKMNLLVLTTVFLISCAPAIVVNTGYDKYADFSAYKTFSIAPVTVKGTVNPENLEHIETSIREAMYKKGFTENNTRPDLEINVETVVKNKETTTTTTSYSGSGTSFHKSVYWSMYGKSAGLTTTIEEKNLRDGSLIISVVDAGIKQKIWFGTANAELTKTLRNPEKVINSAINKMMTDFPAANAQK